MVPDGLKNDTVTLVFPAVPAAAGGQSYAHFRLSTDAGFVADPQPTGAASDGEVEDYGPYQIFTPDGDGVNGTWISPSDWSGNVVPQPIDSVVVPSGTKAFFYDPAYLDQTYHVSMMHVADGASLIMYRQGGDRLLVSGSALIEGQLDLQAKSSTIGGSGTWYVTGDVNWEAGSLGADVGTIELHGNTRIVGDEVKQMTGGTLRNFANMQYTGDSLQHFGGTFVNEASGVFDIRTDGNIDRTDGGHNWTNFGTVRKFIGSEAGLTVYNNPFGELINEGIIEVVSGKLSVAARGSGNGQFIVQPGATLFFSGGSDFQFGSGSQIVGIDADNELSTIIFSQTGSASFRTEGQITAGRLLVFTRPVMFNHAAESIKLKDVALASGQLGGSATIQIEGDVSWTGGTLGGGTGSIELHGDTSVVGDNLKLLAGGTVRNFGTMEYTGDTLRHFGGIFVNEATGVFDIRTDSDFARHDGGHTWINSGTVRKFAGSADGLTVYTNLFGDLTNDGVFEVVSGSLSLTARGNGDGQFIVQPGAELSFTGPGNYDFGPNSQIVAVEEDDAVGTITISRWGYGSTASFRTAGKIEGGLLRVYERPVTITNTTDPIELNNVFLASGELGGPAEIHINGDLTLQGGHLVNPYDSALGQSVGEIHLHNNTIIQGTAARGFFGNVTNHGTIAWTGTGQLNTGGNFINEGTWRIQTDATMARYSHSFQIENRGTIIKEPDPDDLTIGHGWQQFVVEKLTNTGTIELNSGKLNFRTAGTYCNIGMCPFEQREDGRLVLDGATFYSDKKIYVNGGQISGDGIIDADIDQSAGAWLPGASPGQIQIHGTHSSTAGDIQWNFEITGAPLDSEDNSTAGVNFDQITVDGDLQLQGTLNISTLGEFRPNPGDSYRIITADSITGTFSAVTGLAVSRTLGWEVVYSPTEITLVAKELDEEGLAELLRQQFNQGVLDTRTHLPQWLDSGEIGLPGTDQTLGELFAQQIDTVAALLLPTADNPVAELSELQSQLESIGYRVTSLPDGAANEVLKVALSNTSTPLALSTPTVAGAFDPLSKIPDVVDLQGQLNWTGSLNLTDVSLGIDLQGFYIDPSSQLHLSVYGGGNVSDSDVAISNGLELDYEGIVTVDQAKPVSVALHPLQNLYATQFAMAASQTFNINSAGEASLEVTHTLNPGDLVYEGIWNILQDCSGEQCQLQEISSTVDYPSVDDWLATGIGLFQGIIETIFGDATAANFATLSLPLIADADATDQAPSLFGTNTALVQEQESSWMDKLFGATRSIVSFFDSEDGKNTIPSEGQGQFHTQGDRLIGADVVRFDREVDGGGTRIGVISTGADGLLYSQVSGDIPANLPTLIGDDAHGGRGTAMLEVIHDVAPGAELSFASATDSASLLDAITWLIELQDVDVIVSDVVDYAASMFEVDPINAAIQQRLTEHNVLFIQAAGNDAQASYRGVLDMTTVQDGSATRQLHRFGGTAGNPVTTLPVLIQPGSAVRVVLQTSQPYNAPAGIVVAGIESLPEDIQLDRTGFPLSSSAGRDPRVPRTVDSFTLANEAQDAATVHLQIELLGGELAAGTEFQLVVLGDAHLSQTSGSSLFGAAQLDDVLVVGAVEMSQDSQPAPYSSAGSPTGRKVDVVAPAGVETSGFGTRFLSDFHGTSSAAAHAAAAMALLNQVAPTATHSQIRAALQDSAKPLGTGVGDLKSGQGLIDVVAAAQLLVPKSTDPAEPPAEPETGLLDYLNDLPQFASISLPTQQQLEQMLSGAQALFTDLLQLQITLSGDSIGNFAAELPFDLRDIGSFDQFEASGRVAIDAEPEITLQLGWDDSGPYLDVAGSQVQVNLTGVGEARGVALQTFGLGAGATITAQPFLDLEPIDRAADGKIRLDDAASLVGDITNGDFSLVIPQLTTVDADLYGDVILAFLDYVDVDRDLPNTANGGDPFIVRGRANLQLDLSGPGLNWSFSEFRVSNPDIDEDGEADYTLGVLAENAMHLGETLINAIQVPDFVTQLLGQVGMGLGALRDEALTMARGMLPSELIETAEATDALSAINAHIAAALTAVQGDASQVDSAQLSANIQQELSKWLVGDDSDDGASGEGPSQAVAIMDRLEVLFNDITRAQVDDPSTPEDEFELSLNQAVSSYLRWKSALAQADFEPEEVATESQLQRLHERLENSLRYAIQRAHVGAIELHLAGAPLNHVYEQYIEPPSEGFPNGIERQRLVERGVFDRAVEAVRWAQTAEYLEMATVANGLTVAQALEDFSIRVNVEQQKLLFPDTATGDGYIGGDEHLLLEIRAGWQIKLPGNGNEPDIDDYDGYDFGPMHYDAAGNISLHLSGASNNNLIAGPQLALSRDLVTDEPKPSQELGITRGQTDAAGNYQTQVRLGERDTFAQVQVDVALVNVPMANSLTNRIEGRPAVTLLGAHGSEDEQSLRDENLYVEPSGLIALEARVRRGNGPYENASLSFFLSGGGSLDQVDVSSTYHVPRTDSYGAATVFYTAPHANAGGGTQTVRIGAVLVEDGQFFEDLLDVHVVYEKTALLPDRNPIAQAEQDQTAETQSIRDAFADALAESSFQNLPANERQQLVDLVLGWFEHVQSAAQTALEDASAVSASDIRQVEGFVAYAVGGYLEWLAFAKLAQMGDVAGQAEVQANLMAAMESLVSYWLGRFDGSAQTGGILPLYDAIAWSNAIESLTQAHPDLVTPSTSNRARVLDRSGVAIELLPVDATQIEPAPRWSGPTRGATLELRAQVVIRDESGAIVPVMQDNLTPAPVEVTLDPKHGAVANIAIPPEVAALIAHADKPRRTMLLGSLLVVQDPVRGAEFVPVDSKLSATIIRLANQRDLAVDLHFGLPGLTLTTIPTELRDPPELELTGKVAADSDPYSESLVLEPGQEAELKTTLFRNNKPVQGEVQLSVIGRGRLSQVLLNTGTAGLVENIRFTPPVTPLDINDTHGASQITASYLQDGVIYTDTITIRYQYDATGNDGELLGTPDNIRAVNRLELALRAETTVDAETGLPIVDQVAYRAAAVQILHDWWNGMTIGEGGVSYWLQQVQSPQDGGIYPLDTEWKDNANLRDLAFRRALDDAQKNWLQWQVVAAQLGIEPSLVISNAQQDQLHSLVVDALDHAIDRATARAQARATEYIDARSSGNFSDAQLESLLARIIQEGDTALKYYSRLLYLRDFWGVEVSQSVELEDLRAQLPYEVVVVEQESFLAGTLQNAQVNVKAGLHVKGLQENGVPILFQPPASSPLVVQVDPLGNASMSGSGLGRTDASGLYDRANVSIGEGDSELAVNVTVIFNFDNLDERDPAIRSKARGFAYATQRLVFDPSPRVDIRWATQSEGPAQLSDRSRSVVDGQRVLVEVKVTKGRRPRVGQQIVLTKLGKGDIDTGVHITDGSGRVRVYFQPPDDEVGRTQIAVAYQVDGVTIVDTVNIDYTTSAGELEINRAYSKAQAIAEAKLAQHLAVVSLNALIGDDREIDSNLVEGIQLEWLRSGLDDQGQLVPDEPQGVLARVVAAQQAQPQMSRRLAAGAA